MVNEYPVFQLYFPAFLKTLFTSMYSAVISTITMQCKTSIGIILSNVVYVLLY